MKRQTWHLTNTIFACQTTEPIVVYRWNNLKSEIDFLKQRLVSYHPVYTLHVDFEVFVTSWHSDIVFTIFQTWSSRQNIRVEMTSFKCFLALLVPNKCHLLFWQCKWISWQKCSKYTILRNVWARVCLWYWPVIKRNNTSWT